MAFLNAREMVSAPSTNLLVGVGFLLVLGFLFLFFACGIESSLLRGERCGKQLLFYFHEGSILPKSYIVDDLRDMMDKMS